MEPEHTGPFIVSIDWMSFQNDGIMKSITLLLKGNKSVSISCSWMTKISAVKSCAFALFSFHIEGFYLVLNNRISFKDCKIKSYDQVEND